MIDTLSTMASTIVVSDLYKAYGETRAVDGVSFTVEPGEFFGILGPNGAGKTTTLEMIEGLRRPDGGEVLGLPQLVSRILALPRQDRWQTMARAALRDDLHTVHAQLTAQVLADTEADQPVPVRIADWEDRDAVVVSRSVSTLEEICSDEHVDLARLSVGLRVVRTLLSGP